MNESQQRSKLLPVIAVLAVAVIFVVTIKRWPDGEPIKPDDKPKETAKKSSDRSADTALQSLREKAVELQESGDWCDAASAWKQVLAAMPKEVNEGLASLQQEADTTPGEPINCASPNKSRPRANRFRWHRRKRILPRRSARII